MSIIQELVEDSASSPLAKVNDKLPGPEEEVLGNLWIEFLPEPKMGSQEAEQLT